MTRPLLPLLLALLVLAPALSAQDPAPPKPAEPKPADPAPAALPTDKFEKAGGPAVVFSLPKGWTAKTSSSSMRLADVTVPGTDRSAAATCVVFWFGENGAGPVEANIERWVGQLETKEKPVRETIEVAPGIKAHLVELGGRYVAAVQPGQPEKNDQADWRLLGAIVETKGGPLYLKLVGPNATVTAGKEAFMTWVKSFRMAKG